MQKILFKILRPTEGERGIVMTLKEDLLAKIKANKEKNEAILASIPEQYRIYVQMLERNAQVAKDELNLDKTLKDNGVFLYKNATYMKTTTVYLTVAGRIAMVTDYAEANGMELINAPAELLAVNGQHYCQKTITLLKDGKVKKQSTGLASIGFGGTGVDRTNPLENAETSALGRAIGFMGIGQAEWIATADEVNETQNRQEPSKKAPVESEPKNEPEQEVKGPLFEVKNVEKKGTGGKIVAVEKDTGEQCTFWYTKDQWGKVTVVEGDIVTGTPKEYKGAKKNFITLENLQVIAS